MAVSMALFSSVAAASLLSMSKARSAVTKKAQQLSGGTALSSSAKGCKRLSSKKVSCTAVVQTATQTCTDKMIVTRTSTALKVKADAFPTGWLCTP
jgi:hypothetical protein